MDPITSAVALVCSLTSIGLSIINAMMIVNNNKFVIDQNKLILKQLKLESDKRRRDYVKAVCSNNFGKPFNN